jgi:hypothetical protein
VPLIHGARSVLLRARAAQPDRLREWAHRLAKTHVHNQVAVALANKRPGSSGPSGLTHSLTTASPPSTRPRKKGAFPPRTAPPTRQRQNRVGPALE